MAHYAIIIDDIVQSVFVGVDETEDRGVGPGTEHWEAYYAQRPWIAPALVRRCSYNGNIRKNYPSSGYTWDESRDAFIPPKPDNAIGFDEETCTWITPPLEQ